MVKVKKYILPVLFILLSLGIGFSLNQALVLTPVSPTNYTNYSYHLGLKLNISISPANNATFCSYDFGFYNNTVTTAFLTNMTNSTTTNTSFHNATAVSINTDSGFDGWHNVTFRCRNGTDWYNTTVLFGMDQTAPIVNNMTYTLANTTGGNLINVTFNVSDNHTYSCPVRIIDMNGAVENTINATIWDYAWNGRCNIVLYPSNFTKTGAYTIQGTAEDLFGNSSVSIQNISVNVWKLKTGWNLLTLFENLTMNVTAYMIPNISYVSSYHNLFKNYTTLTKGLSTYAGILLNATNATYLYVSQDNTLIRPYYSINTWTNVTLYDNGTGLSGASGWNQMGIKSSQTLNETLYNSSMRILGPNGESNTSYTNANITYVAYYNATLGKMCSAKRGMKTTSCYPDFNVTDITVQRGEAIWILVDTNITYERV